MNPIDPQRWAALSPLLDELLDLPGPARSDRLAGWRAQGNPLVGDLERLLAREAEVETGGFLLAGALPPPPGLAGQTVGAYTLEHELGQGGMGQVWRARRTDGRFEGTVAIKLLHGGWLRPGEAERFAREGRILARLDHRHIARLLDAGVTDDGRRPYLVLEHVDGEPIDRHVQRLDLPPRAVLALMRDAAEAVAHAHARLVLHRDLKPSNMLVSRAGEVKLLDFGIAKLLDDRDPGAADGLTQRAGQALTPLYAAPEQLLSQEVTTATDVYALGVLLYRLLGGGHPTGDETDTALERARATIEQPPRRLSERVRQRGGTQAARRARELAGDVDTLVARALAKRPADRYANAAELAEDLRRVLAHEPIRARPEARLYRLSKFVRRHRVPVAAGALAAAALLTGTALAMREARQAQAQRVQAEGLIEFMLGDLRQRLQPVGRLDVLDAVGEKALAYYAAQSADRLDAESLGRRARALHLIGEIAETRGQFDEAARRFEQATQATRTLLQRHPGDGQRIFDHAQSEFWVGVVARRRGRLDEAAAAFERYRSLATELAAVAAERPEWRVERAYAEQNIGVLQLERARAAEARASLQRARDILQAERAARPALDGDLAKTLGFLARAQERLGDLSGAVATNRERIALAGPRPGHGVDRNLQYGAAVGHHEMARLQLDMADLAGAERSARDAVAALQALTTFDPSNLGWRAALGLARIRLAETLHHAGLGGEAATVLDAARQTMTPLWAAADGRPYWQQQIRAAWLATRGLLQPPRRGDPTFEAMQALTARYGPEDGADESASRQLARVELALGDAWQRAGDGDAAHRHWQAALTRLSRLDRSPDIQTVTALAQWRLGRHQVARELADSVRAGPYRHPVFADLVRTLGVPAPARPAREPP